jgi:hypothetical protein
VSQYNIRQPSRHIPYPGYRCEYQSAPLLLHLLLLLHTSATTACLSRRLNLQSRDACKSAKTLLVMAESQCGLASLTNTGTLLCVSIVHFEATRNCKAREDFRRGGHGTFAPSRGWTVVMAQHQQPPLQANRRSNGSPMTAFEPGSDLHRAQCACLLLQGEARPVTISIYPQPLSTRPHLGLFSPLYFSGYPGLVISCYYVF